jgi:hypothetical protein
MTTGSQNTSTLHLPVDGGMDQRHHPRQVATPATIQTVNARFPRVGAVDKRAGCDSLATNYTDGTAIHSDAQRLLAFRDELLTIDGFNIGSLTLPGGVPKVLNKGKVPEAVSTSRAIDTTEYFVSQPDVAYSSDGLVFHIWATNDRSTITGGPAFVYTYFYDIFWTVQDATTGAEIISSTSTTTGAQFWCPRVVAVNNNAMMFYANAGNIVALLWNPSTLAFSSLGSILTGTTGQGFDVCSDGTSIYLVYGSTTNIVTVKKYNPITGALISTINCSANILPTVARNFSICANAGERVWIAFTRMTNVDSPTAQFTVQAAAYDTALLAETTVPFTVHSANPGQHCTTAIARVTSTTAVILLGQTTRDPYIYGNALDASDSFMSAPVVSSAGAIVGNATAPNRRTYWAVPGSAPFVVSTSPLRVYAWAYVGGAYLTQAAGVVKYPSTAEQPLQFTYMLLDIGADDTANAFYVARPITWQSPRFSMTDSRGPAYYPGGGAGDGQVQRLSKFNPPNVVALPNSTWLTDDIVLRAATGRSGLNEVRAVFDGPSRYIASELGHTMVMTPGFYWDRSKLAEINYAYWPQKPDTATPAGPSATGGFMTNTKLYTYRVVYEFVDATGAIHRSQPSDPVTVTIPAGGPVAGSCSMWVPCITATTRQGARPGDSLNGIRIVVYRAGPLDIDPVTYYRVFDDNATPRNDPTLARILITDTRADFGSVAGPTVQADTLYTMGGVLPNVMPNGFTSVCTYLNRIWVAAGNTVSYSKAFVTGEAISFTDAFDLPLEEGGDITALWVMDDTLYIGTRDRIYYLQAYGPNDAGGANDVNIPNRVATDLGVIDQRSIVITPGGTMYQSPVGIQLMSRSREVNPEPVGSRMRDDLALYPEITSAIMHPTGRYVSFCARNPTPSAGVYQGVRLIYDYATDRWSRDTVLSGSSSDQVGQGLVGEAVSRGKVYLQTSNATNSPVYAESTTSNLDSGAWVTMSVELAEVHPAGLQGWLGFKKWTLLNEKFTDHDISLTFIRDYDTAPFETKTWISNALPIDEQFSHNATIHRAQSMRMKITDAAPTGGGAVTGTGRGSSFIGLAVEVDPIDNKTFRLPAGSKG